MRKLIILSILFLGSVSLLKAQEVKKNKTSKSSGGGGGFTIGYGNMDVSKLHVFVPNNVKKFSDNQMVIGGTGHAIINNFVIGGSGFAITGDVITTDSIKIGLSGGVGTFDFGYLILDKNQIKIFPMLGIGGASYGLQITKNKNISIGNIVNNPGNEINLGTGGIVADISINLNIFPFLQYDEKKDSYGGFLTGLKIGYLYSIPSSNWTFSGGDIIGAPSFGLNMIYAKLIIGGFGYQKKL